MALFDDVPPPKKGFFKKKNKDGIMETGSNEEESPQPKSRKESATPKGGHASVNFAEGPPPAAQR